MTLPLALIFLCGLMGAGGVVLLAAAAHGANATGADSAGLGGAATLLLLHAGAVLALLAMLDRAMLWRPLALIAAAGFILGAALFAGDIALRAFAGHRLFPMAAPTGGMILILSWLALSAAAIMTALRG